ncbi:MAG: RimK family alpha-L-glutamate ligase [Planctomycetota bacterium]|nr:RimK family alpha-L-glutamate ligase [Planctomycetota bacterium]
MSETRILCLGAGNGWHRNQLQQASDSAGVRLETATYESLAARIEADQTILDCEAGRLDEFDAILTRTMPAGSLETITFRLAVLHQLENQPGGPVVVNPARSLELAIDKFATLARVRQLGFAIPDTIVVQSRHEALDAWDSLGGDCIVKPIFGGEGRGVMRITDRELAWTTFATLERLDSIMYVQRFVPPGGCDTRLLLIGDEVIGLRRENQNDFRANVASGGSCQAIELETTQIEMAHQICSVLGLNFAAVDLIHDCDDAARVIEVNAIPGWKGAQTVTPFPIADRIVELLKKMPAALTEAKCS